LLGDAGSGKTTLLRQLTGALAKAWLDKDPGYARERTGLEGELWLPLFVSLRYFHHYCQASPGRAVVLGHFFDFYPFTFASSLAWPCRLTSSPASCRAAAAS
jgi:hypothetical protein